MPKIRLYTQNKLQENQIIELSQDQSHYLCSVMRQKSGDTISIFNGVNGQWSGEIISAAKKNCTVQIKMQTKQQKSEPDIYLCFAPVKNAPINNIVQKATELGVSKLVPIYTERTVISRVNTDRLKLIAIEAAEQSERLNIPQIDEAIKLTTLLKNWNEDRGIILCDESGGGISFTKALEQSKYSKYAIFIGPEGGFSQSEFELMKNKPYVISVSMGPRILRADTAAIASLACYMNILGDWHEKPNFNG